MEQEVIKVEEPEVPQEETPKTFDELLQNPEYQREFDKKVAKALEKSKVKWQKEADAQRDEAERLAKMDSEEKHQYELSKANEERDSAKRELNAYKLKEEATKIAREKGIDIALLNIIDYTKETAETVKDKLDNLSKVYSKAVEDAVNDRLKQHSPITVANTGANTSEQEYMRNKYGNNPYFKK